jgi:hypothetical protein
VVDPLSRVELGQPPLDLGQEDQPLDGVLERRIRRQFASSTFCFALPPDINASLMAHAVNMVQDTRTLSRPVHVVADAPNAAVSPAADRATAGSEARRQVKRRVRPSDPSHSRRRIRTWPGEMTVNEPSSSAAPHETKGEIVAEVCRLRQSREA